MIQHLRLSIFIFTLLCFYSANVFAQPANNSCATAQTLPQDGTCIGGTTAGSTDTWPGNIGCQTGNPPDVWYTFTATGTVSQITVTNGTQTGQPDIHLISATSACSGLALEGADCVGSPNSATFTTVVGQLYYVLISTQGTQGTFTICNTVSTPPPSPGQDCITADVLCNGSAVTNGVMTLGNGTVAENSQASSGWSSCIFSEQSSQWYTFMAGASGTFALMVDPSYYVQQNGPDAGDDFDWELYNITASGCTNSAVSLACDYSGAVGSTGFSATGGAGFGQVINVDYSGDGASGGTQWNTTNVSLVAGNTYAIMVQNYSNSQGGMTLSYGGTAQVGPSATFTPSLSADCMTVTVSRGTAYTGANMTYLWNFGDGFTSTSGTPGSHTYASTGNYTISLIVSYSITNSSGTTTCSDVFSTTVNVGCVLPIELLSFDAVKEGEKVKLLWETATEVNNDYFTIERSINGLAFQPIAVIDGAGNNQSLLKYSHTDNAPLKGVSYYRLKQTDYDGTSTYSDIKSVSFIPSVSLQFKVYPNPSGIESDVKVAFVGSPNEQIVVSIYDITGKVLYQNTLNLSETGEFAFDLDHHFSSGMYFINATSKSGASYNQKLMVK